MVSYSDCGIFSFVNDIRKEKEHDSVVAKVTADTTKKHSSLNGQIKSLVSDIRFLSTFVGGGGKWRGGIDCITIDEDDDCNIKERGRRQINLIYAGSAPGHHIPILDELYHRPQQLQPKESDTNGSGDCRPTSFRWFLFDYAKHCLDVKTLAQQNPDRFVINKHGLTEQSAKELKATFISKKSSGGRHDSNENPESLVVFISDLRNIALQNELLSIIEPDFASLKYRYPYHKNYENGEGGDTICYYKPVGLEILQPYVEPYSSEFLIFVKSAPIFTPVNHSYCKMMARRFFYYNDIIRNVLNNDDSLTREILASSYNVCKDMRSLGLISEPLSTFSLSSSWLLSSSNTSSHCPTIEICKEWIKEKKRRFQQ